MLKKGRTAKQMADLCDKHSFSHLQEHRALAAFKTLIEMKDEGALLTFREFSSRSGLNETQWNWLRANLLKIPGLSMPSFVRREREPSREFIQLERKFSSRGIRKQQLLREIETMEEIIIEKRQIAPKEINQQRVLQLAMQEDPNTPTGWKYNYRNELADATGVVKGTISKYLSNLRGENPHLAEALDFKRRSNFVRGRIARETAVFFQRKPTRKEKQAVQKLHKKFNLADIRKPGIPRAELNKLLFELLVLVEKDRNVAAAKLLEKLTFELACTHAINALKLSIESRQKRYFFVKEREDIVLKTLQQVIYNFNRKDVKRDEVLKMFYGYLRSSVGPRMKFGFVKFAIEKERKAKEKAEQWKDKLAEARLKPEEPTSTISAEEKQQLRLIAYKALKSEVLSFTEFLVISFYNLTNSEIAKVIGGTYSLAHRIRSKAVAKLQQFVKENQYI